MKRRAEEGGGPGRRTGEEFGMSGGGPEQHPEEDPKSRRHSIVVDFSSMYIDVRFFVDFRRRVVWVNFLTIFAYVR